MMPREIRSNRLSPATVQWTMQVESSSRAWIRLSLHPRKGGTLIEIRFIKFNSTPRAYQTISSPLEGLARPRALPRRGYREPEGSQGGRLSPIFDSGNAGKDTAMPLVTNGSSESDAAMLLATEGGGY
jgi:hypothetical protein